MANITDISSYNLINVFEYVQFNDIKIIPRISKYMKEILDTNSPYWEKKSSEICKPKGNSILCDQSPGLTCLIVNAGFRVSRCISCKSQAWVHRHEFYDVPICIQCENINMSFMFGGFKSICKKYYLDPEKHENDENISKIRVGSNYRVLDSHVLKAASIFHTNGVLLKKLELRNLRKELVTKKRFQKCKERRRKVKYEFEKLVSLNDVRVHEDLSQFISAEKIAYHHEVGDYIFGDCFRPIIDSFMSFDEASHRLFEFVCLVTFMEKRSLLDASYCANDDAHMPGHIYKGYRKSGVHFYELVTRYSDARASYWKRLDKMSIYICVKILDADQRKKLAISTCIEDGVTYDCLYFSDFVDYGVGNPVSLAREKRKNIFMNSNGYESIYGQLMNFHGLGSDIAHRYAKKRILNRTHGFPPMIPICSIDY